MRFFGVNPGEHPEYIVVGLGNFGKRYENTRHNIGFKIVDYLCSSSHGSPTMKRVKHYSLTHKAVFGGYIVLFAKPQTFMNNSGMAIKDILDYYSMSPQQLIIIHDDVSLDVGAFRIDKNGGDFGHEGLKSVIEHLNSDEFIRLRIGIGPKPHDNNDFSSFALSRFSDSERKEIDELLFVFKNLFVRLFENGLDDIMGIFNRDFRDDVL